MAMHVISKRLLREFWTKVPESELPLIRWHTQMVRGTFGSFADLKRAIPAADWVKPYVVFDIGGNKYRLVADVVFQSSTVFVKSVMTHTEYRKWKP